MDGVGGGLGDVSDVAAHLDRRVRVLPLGRALPGLHDRVLVGDLSGHGVQDVDRAVGGEDVGQVLRAARHVSEGVLDTLGERDRLQRALLGVDQRDRVEQVALGIGVGVVVTDDEGAGLGDVRVAHPAVLVGRLELLERTVPVEQGAVLAAEDDRLVGRGALAVDTGTRVVGGDLLEAVTLRRERDRTRTALLGAHRGQQGAVLEDDRDAVVGLGSRPGRGLRELAGVAQRGGVEDGRLAAAVGEQDRPVAVVDDVPTRVGLEDEVGQLGGPGVEHLETLAGGDGEVAAVADRVETYELLGLELVDDLEGLAVQDGDPVGVGHREAAALVGLRGRRLLAFGGGAARRERQRYAGHRRDGSDDTVLCLILWGQHGCAFQSVGPGESPLVMRSVLARIMER